MGSDIAMPTIYLLAHVMESGDKSNTQACPVTFPSSWIQSLPLAHLKGGWQIQSEIITIDNGVSRALGTDTVFPTARGRGLRYTTQQTPSPELKKRGGAN